MKLHISTDLSLPLDAATQTFAFIARKGAGKTYAAGKLTELLLDAGVQVVILDTVGNWYGLRLSADGKGKGFDVPVFGGLRADLPLEAGAGELVADVTVDTGRSLVLDLSQFSLSDRKRFATSFGERLWKRKKGEAHPSPLMLVIEESQLIIPQFTGRDDARMVGIYEEIIRLGRNYGIGCTMISQRPQSVNKEVLNQTECLFVGQISGSQERDALKKWIMHQGMDVNLVDQLPSLPVGKMYVWSPQWLNILKQVQIGKKTTLDASSTPKVGAKTERRDPAPLDLHEIQQQMAGIVERAKADDPRTLRAELAKVRGELAKAQSAKPAPAKTETKTVERFVLKDGQLVRADKLITRMADLFTQLKTTIDGIAGAIGKTQVSPARVAASERSIVQRKADAAVMREAAGVPRHSHFSSSRAGTNGDAPTLGNSGKRRMLIALAQNHSGLTARKLSILTGISRKGGTWRTYLGELRGADWVGDAPDRMLFITDAGIAALGSYDPLPTGPALISYWQNNLGDSGKRRIFDVLVSAYPNALSKEDVSHETGIDTAGGTWRTYVGELRGLELIEGSREMKASDDLFL